MKTVVTLAACGFVCLVALCWLIDYRHRARLVSAFKIGVPVHITYGMPFKAVLKDSDDTYVQAYSYANLREHELYDVNLGLFRNYVSPIPTTTQMQLQEHILQCMKEKLE